MLWKIIIFFDALFSKCSSKTILSTKCSSKTILTQNLKIIKLWKVLTPTFYELQTNELFNFESIYQLFLPLSPTNAHFIFHQHPLFFFFLLWEKVEKSTPSNSTDGYLIIIFIYTNIVYYPYNHSVIQG